MSAARAAAAGARRDPIRIAGAADGAPQWTEKPSIDPKSCVQKARNLCDHDDGEEGPVS